MTSTATMFTPLDFSTYPWMRFALQELGQAETANRATNNPRILLCQAEVKNALNDEVPWCSAFANWCMHHSGHHGTGFPNARSWLTWGEPLKTPTYGCVAVFARGKPWQGHVAFFVGDGPGAVVVIGGNQSSRAAPSGSVCIASYSQNRLLAYRWPSGFPHP
jgi:uncharacterized protein (TIGR02594 family)